MLAGQHDRMPGVDESVECLDQNRMTVRIRLGEKVDELGRISHGQTLTNL